MILAGTRYEAQVGRHCASPRCSAEVIWCHTDGKKQMLVDARQVEYVSGQPFGNIRLVDVGTLTPLATVLKANQLFGRQGTLHNSHFATCPDAARFRRRGYER